MDTSLESRIATLRAQVRRILALHGMSWVIGLVVPVIVIVGLLDWMVHLDPLVRLAALIGLIGFGLWLGFRHVIAPLIVRFPDLEIAMRIEERWPGLNDRLASTVQFLRMSGDDDRFGSPALREATIRQTLEETRSIDFREVIEPKPLVRALGAASAALMFGLVFLLAAPDLSSIALKRLFQPFGSTRWPQRTHLSLLRRETPGKVARGEPFTLGVSIAKGETVPASARATYRFSNGEVVTEPLRAVEGGIFRGRLETVERDFTFSVAAGDDSTSIRNVAVRVVPPPALKQVAIRMVPPAYTAIAPFTLAAGNTQIRAVEGTRVEINAQANKPIRAAALHLGESAAPQPVRIDKARTGLNTSFEVVASLPFWFELHDTDGFANREAPRYDVRSIRDEAPRVVIDQPPNDRDVPAKAVVPVRFTVDDDYGIQTARILYQTASGGSEPTSVVVLPLWDAKDQPAGQPSKHQEVAYEWNLAPLNLPPGSVITFHAEALDIDNLKGPNLGKSRELRLRIVSEEEIGRQLDDQRREIREETARILAMEKQAQLPVNDAIRKLETTDTLDQAGRDDLKNAEMIQRQVGSRINSRTDGLDQKINRFLDDLKNFKVPNPDAEKQMQEMKSGVERIRDKHLGPAEQGLTHAAKNLDEAQAGKPKDARNPQDAARPAPEAGQEKGAQTPSKPEGKSATRPKNGPQEPAKDGTRPDPDASNPKPAAGDPAKADPAPQPPRNRFSDVARNDLKESRANQKAIADELQKMLDGLSEFETYRGVVKDAQNLLKEQEQTMKQTAEAASKAELMGKTPENLTPEQKADLANLADRQGNVSRGLQGLQEQMNEMATKLDESDPLAAAALREAADESRKKGTAAKMGETADQLAKNQMGEARSGQDQARQELKDLVDSIQNRRERELARLVKELKNAEAELKALKERQTQNLKKTEAARKNQNAKERGDELKKLAKEQAEIEKELTRQLKKLAKLNAEGAAQAGSRAAAKMSKAKAELDEDQGEQAGNDQEEALADLEDAEEQVAQTRKDLEEQLAMEQLAKMGDELKSLAERQAKMVEDITGYETLRAKREGSLTIAQRNGVRGLGRVQEGLKDESAGLTEKLEGAPVFALTLKRAGQAMDEAAQRLLTLKTDEETQRAARSAARRFEQLINSLKPDKPKNGGQGQGGGDGQGGGGGGDGIPPAAQVKMLKALQEEINDRTEFFDELRRRKHELTPLQNEELGRLETDQGTLADLARDLTRPKKEDGED
ncbi:protein of unknown function [Singulisphaera sp. GP187]|uniref:DUF4175 family protein n=1 Tax=Singulisphaera sp. GP187 TaxID=1882752 RepID=UPI00092B6AC9|nr:DUF4175 family protein [Singulisphaera sp. GP187]SIO67299.1 protein of unknown function [Singulisphaera sp. GP187]